MTVITPIGGALGAEIRGIDLRHLDDRSGAVISQAIAEHLVVFLPDQALDDDTHLEVARRFGTPFLHPLAKVVGKSEARVERIVDDADHPPMQDKWHTDVSFAVDPPRIGTLRAVDLPLRGGETLWGSTCAAYDALSPLMRELIDGLVARHGIGAGDAFRSKAGEAATAAIASLTAEHPVVATHPVTGRKHLYVNRSFTREIVGLHPAESDALLEVLYRQIENPNVQLRHRWSVGEIALWDERATVHFAVADHYPARREMARVALG